MKTREELRAPAEILEMVREAMEAADNIVARAALGKVRTSGAFLPVKKQLVSALTELERLEVTEGCVMRDEPNGGHALLMPPDRHLDKAGDRPAALLTFRDGDDHG